MADANRSNELGSSTTGSISGAVASMAGTFAPDWQSDESWWQENFRDRSYATADRDFSYYSPAYRYGYESAGKYQGQSWSDTENDLRSGWDKYEYRGASTWENVKDAVRDAWDRVTERYDVHVSNR
ncbi:MAG: hypothetical protein H0T48_15705 [Gemmatimonadaceae bacterium]|nr:hypothetical protein [Gemmatimonadaceae bacterium]